MRYYDEIKKDLEKLAESLNAIPLASDLSIGGAMSQLSQFVALLDKFKLEYSTRSDCLGTLIILKDFSQETFFVFDIDGKYVSYFIVATRGIQ